MKSLLHERLRTDRYGVIHIHDDSMNDGFAWCGKAPTQFVDGDYPAATCLVCIVKAAKYRGLE